MVVRMAPWGEVRLSEPKSRLTFMFAQYVQLSTQIKQTQASKLRRDDDNWSLKASDSQQVEAK